MPSVLCSCGKTIDARPEWAGAFIRCGQCASKVYVPRPEDSPAPPEPAGAEDTRPCPYCAEPIRTQAVKCRWCGQSLALGRVVATAVRVRPAVRTDTGGTGILVIAIIGWVVWCLAPILSPIAWAMGASHESYCRSQGMEPSGACKAGKILGIIGTVIFGGLGLLVLLGMIAGGMR